MASLDITSKVDHQVLDNVINVVKKDILNRFDFKDTKTTIELDKKALSLNILSENTMKISSIEDCLISRSVKQQLDPKCFDFSKEAIASGAMMKKEIKVREGIDKETAKKVLKAIKDSNIKVQAAIMDDIVRVTSKKIDDLQLVMKIMRESNFDVPLQFINLKS